MTRAPGLFVGWWVNLELRRYADEGPECGDRVTPSTAPPTFQGSTESARDALRTACDEALRAAGARLASGHNH